MTKKHVNCGDVLINASAVLSDLYTEKSFDSIRVAVNIMEQSCGEGSLPVIYIKTLLDIQQSSFSVNELSASARLDTLFTDYLFTLRTLKKGGYSINKYQYYTYSASEKDFYSLIRKWASDLLNSQRLNNSETFICNVLAGNTRHPAAQLKSDKTQYPELYALLKKNYTDERLQPAFVATLISGVWLPSGNAKILGAHPTIGFQFCGKNKRNELDLTMQLRFANTPNNYYVFRSDSLYALNHFFGGYIGLDYTHYFIRSTNFEAGLTAGIGFDGFDIADPPTHDHRKDYLKPFSINSLNLNTGLKINYYFNPNLFIGIAAKYNKISYGNKGGSSLSGNPISIDFIIGGPI